jgi:hypothetical protein
VDWESAEAIELALSDLEKRPAQDATFADLPSAGSQARSYTAWSRDFANWLYATQTMELLRSPSLGVVSNPGESERDFRVRLQQSAREKRDDAVEALRKKHAPKLARLQEKRRNAEQAVEREKEQSRQQGLQAVISIGSTLLGAFTGRKTGARSTIGKATTAARGIGRAMDGRGDVSRAQEDVESINKDIENLEAEFETAAKALEDKLDPQNELLETISVKPKKADISVQMVALLWAPYWQDEQGGLKPAF